MDANRRALIGLSAGALAAVVIAFGGLPGTALAAAGGAVAAPASPDAETGTVERIDPGLDSLIDRTASIERVATGFKFVEAPLWRRSQGVLWFSDVVGNVVYQLSADGKVTQVLNPGGYDGNALPAGGYVGPNGMAVGPNDTVTLCQHGNRRIVSVGPDRKVTVLVDHFEGRRLNSPNDVVYAPDGSFYFTDPPYGLPKRNDDPDKDLDFNGVFRFANGKLQALIRDIPTPNGIAFSPDYRILYLTNSQGARRQWMAYDLAADGSVSNGRVFADASASTERGAMDSMDVDSGGNLFGTGPGGIWVISPAGKHLGTIRLPEAASSVAFGGKDGRTLYITATSSVYRMRVKVSGQRVIYN